MNELQRRLWRRMLRLTEDYKSGLLSLGTLVGELEGALDAGDFRDEPLQRAFYEAWGPLETCYATRGDDVLPVEIVGELRAMRRFLLERLPERDSLAEM